MKKFLIKVISLLPNSLQSFLARILSFIKKPNYIGMHIVPDNFVFLKIYNFFSILFNFRIFSKRKFKNIKSRYSIDKNKGYLVVNDNDKKFLKAVNCAKKIFKKNKKNLLNKKFKKDFLRSIVLDYNNRENTPIFDFSCDEKIINVISEYLGSKPVLNTANLWYSPNENFSIGNSQSFHLDGEDLRQVKIFINLYPVNKYSGPLTIYPRDISETIYKKLKETNLIKKRNEKIPDSYIEKLDIKSNPVELTGPEKQMAFVDTCSCYHYGSRPLRNKKNTPRIILYLHYTTVFQKKLPTFFKRKINVKLPGNFTEKERNMHTDVLGYQHELYRKVI
ncbi:MAG: hypothetical protein CMI97_03485 [Pelagibacteraceae bacterium]|nr:hypothetical protein [Pelagibacteraceae bacterium]PPR33128.1 MAG: hypothetical protein CFH27_00818 [Alphaproteobacteria bacterium MarineAlpha6_Bin5]|tara:strand:+ start:8420 stop:9421 length:1002 start_codon:yes stop_codon:yes gene_type:complete